MVSIADDSFIKGSIYRSRFVDYNKRYLYRYRGVVADMTAGNVFVKDVLFDDMYKDKILSQETYETYYESLRQLFGKLPFTLDETDEEFYNRILHLRRSYITPRVIEYIKNNPESIGETYAIDQRDLLKEKIDESKALFIFVDECKYLDLIKEFYLNIDQEKQVTFVVHKDAYLERSGQVDISLPNPIFDEHFGIGFDLSKYQVPEGSLIIGFGEWFMAAFKALHVDAFVWSTSQEILTRGLTNASSKTDLQCIYIPKGLDLVSDFEIVEKSLINYRVYDWLLKDHGRGIYDIPAVDLVDKYPDYFISHDSDKRVAIDHVHLSDDLLKSRVDQIQDHMKKHVDGLEMNQMVYRDRNNLPIKVNYFKLPYDMSYDMSILSYDSSQNIRDLYRHKQLSLGIATNFLFFTTEKTIGTYNRLRKNRPKEQYNHFGWHMDYKKDHYETFPLYNKAMIAMTEEGLVFKRMSLDGGKVTINNHEFTWTSDQVNTDDHLDFKIYTPLYYKNNQTYYLEDTCPVGEGRINLVIINKDLVLVKEGDVLLPSIGVVLSFDRDYFTQFLDLDEPLTCQLSLENDYKWAYGGGMFLVHNGQAYDSKEKLHAAFTSEGWLYNLSKQTQDSETFRLDKHPRTVIGQTKAGDLFMFVCAGRSKHSVGADYLDLIAISKELFGDVQHLMNLDGGASSFMGAIIDSEVLALNDITFTNDSCAGMLRPLNSLINIRFK